MEFVDYPIIVAVLSTSFERNFDQEMSSIPTSFHDFEKSIFTIQSSHSKGIV